MVRTVLCVIFLLIGAMPRSASAAPIVNLSAGSVNAIAGNTYDIDVLIAGVTDLNGFQFGLVFDTSNLQVDTVTEGAFLLTGGPTTGLFGALDGLGGFVASALFDPVGVSGDGVLATVRFLALITSNTPLAFANVLLVDSQGQEIPFVDGLAPAPEPATLTLMVLGGLGVASARRRRPCEGGRGLVGSTRR